MSPKQQIYQEMLRFVLPAIRSDLSKRLHWEGPTPSYYDAELVHNLYVSLFEPEFVENDIWFLNWQAKWYYEHAQGRSYHYDAIVSLIGELMQAVPPHLRDQLTWQLPK